MKKGSLCLGVVQYLRANFREGIQKVGDTRDAFVEMCDDRHFLPKYAWY